MSLGQGIFLIIFSARINTRTARDIGASCQAHHGVTTCPHIYLPYVLKLYRIHKHRSCAAAALYGAKPQSHDRAS